MDYVNHSIRDTMWNTHERHDVSSSTRWSYNDTLARNYVHRTQNSDEHREMIRDISIFLRRNDKENVVKEIEKIEELKYDCFCARPKNMLLMTNIINELMVFYKKQYDNCKKRRERKSADRKKSSNYDPVIEFALYYFTDKLQEAMHYEIEH